ncbi:MAG: hypothetical protein AAFU65_17610, partial [Pseudomonadota bacterium]
TDFATARQWHARIDNQRLADSLAEVIALAAGRDHPDEAIRWVMELNENARDKALSGLAATLRTKDHRPVEVISAIADPQMKTNAVLTLAIRYAKSDPQYVQHLIDRAGLPQADADDLRHMFGLDDP